MFGAHNGARLVLVQFSSVTQSCPTICDPMDCSTPGLPAVASSRSLLKLMSIELVMPSNHLILCRPLLLLTSVFPSIRVFCIDSVIRIRRPKYWNFSFSISPSNEHSGLISFRMDWLDLLAFQGTLKSLLQNHSLKASILQHSIFSIVQLLYPYMTTGKAIALTRWTFVCKVMSLLCNMLSRLVIAFLPRTLCNPMDYTVHGVLQARTLEWVAFPPLQQIFPTQESNQGLLHCRKILYQLSYQGSHRLVLSTGETAGNRMNKVPGLLKIRIFGKRPK